MDLYTRFQVLDGDKLVDLLSRIDKIGTAAFANTEKAAKRANSAIGIFEGGLKSLSTQVSGIADGGSQIVKGIGQSGDAFETIGKRMEKTAKRIRNAVLLVTGAVTAAAVAAGKLANDTATAVVETDDQAKALGLTARQHQIYGRVVEANGGKVEDFNEGVKVLNGTIADALQGDADAIARLNTLGVGIVDQNGKLRTTSQILLDLFRNFEQSKIAEVAAIQARGYQSAQESIQYQTARTMRAIDAFGDSAGPKLLPALTSSSRAILAQAQLIDQSGKAFSRADTIIARQFLITVDVAKTRLQGLGDRIGLIFAEKGIGLIDRFSAAIDRNKESIVAFAERSIEWLDKFLDDLIKVFQGEDASAANAWLNTLRTDFLAFAAGVEETWNKVLVPFFTNLLLVLDNVATAINKAFGTNLTGAQLGLLVYVTQFLGILNLIAPIVTIIGGALTVMTRSIPLIIGVLDVMAGLAVYALGFLAAIVGWPVALGLALGALGIVVVEFWDEIVEGAKGALKWLGTFIETLSKAWVAGKAFVQSFGSGGGTGPSEIPGKARGGLIRGPGTGTSDSILAGLGRGLLRVSSGEFIVNAASTAMALPLLTAINSGFIPKFAEGGLVGGMQSGLSASVDMGASGGGATYVLQFANGDQVSMRGEASSLSRMLNSGQFQIVTRNRWHKS